MFVDFIQISLIFVSFLVLALFFIIVAIQSGKKSRTIWTFIVLCLLFVVCLYLSYNNTIPLCDLIKCYG